MIMPIGSAFKFKVSIRACSRERAIVLPLVRQSVDVGFNPRLLSRAGDLLPLRSHVP